LTKAGSNRARGDKAAGVCSEIDVMRPPSCLSTTLSSRPRSAPQNRLVATISVAMRAGCFLVRDGTAAHARRAAAGKMLQSGQQIACPYFEQAPNRIRSVGWAKALLRRAHHTFRRHIVNGGHTSALALRATADALPTETTKPLFPPTARRCSVSARSRTPWRGRSAHAPCARDRASPKPAPADPR
jgi:hypothetical protein